MLITLEVTLTAIVVGIVWGTLLAVARLGSKTGFWHTSPPRT